MSTKKLNNKWVFIYWSSSSFRPRMAKILEPMKVRFIEEVIS